MVFKFILSATVLLSMQGCVYRVITDYDNCVPNALVLEFKKNLNLYIIDDSKGQNKYSSMNFTNGEYYLCIEEEDECTQNYNGAYYQGWKIVPLSAKSFRFTGLYKTNKPNFLLGAFVSESSALQIEINGTKAWLSSYELDKSNIKKKSFKNLEKLHANSIKINDYISVFECSNANVEERDWTLVW